MLANNRVSKCSLDRIALLITFTERRLLTSSTTAAVLTTPEVGEGLGRRGEFLSAGGAPLPLPYLSIFLPTEFPRRHHLHRAKVRHHLDGHAAAVASLLRRDAFGEDTRLYNYGVPMVGRSKLRFPAPRKQEYAARAQRAALRQI